MKRGLLTTALGTVSMVAFAGSALAQDYVEGQVIVKMADGRSPAVLREAASAETPFRSGAQVLTLRAGISVEDAVAALSADPAVEYAEPNYIYTIGAVPNDPLLGSAPFSTSEQWGFDAIDAFAAWDVSTGGTDVVVNVIDTGIMTDHPDLAANIWVNAAEASGTPGVDDDGNGYVDDVNGWNAISNDGNLIDDNGHGTHCSGTIGAVSDNGLQVAGVNWTTQLIGCKFLSGSGSGSTSNAVECLDYINATKEAGSANIVVSSNSWGGGGASAALESAIEDAADNGILFVAAAGNSGQDNDCTASFPANYNVRNVVAVASTTINDGMSGFSQYGASTVDIGAPGSNILSTWNNGGTRNISGTSMATPHVAGAAALAVTINGGIDPAVSSAGFDQLKSILICSGDELPALDGVTTSGKRLNLATMAAQAQAGISTTCTNDDGDAHLNVFDNCPYDANDSQADSDGDGVGDACEPDDCGGGGCGGA